jgi:hypothetical protein
VTACQLVSFVNFFGKMDSQPSKGDLEAVFHRLRATPANKVRNFNPFNNICKKKLGYM